MAVETEPTGGVQNLTQSSRVDAVVLELGRDARLDAPADLLQPATRRLAAGRAGSFLRGEWLGHALHPMLTDLPIGFWTSAFVLDLIGGQSGRRASTRLIGLGLLCALPTAASGAVEWSDIDADRPRRLGVVHAAANSVAMALYYGSWRARHRGHPARGVALGIAGALAASVGGHLGGHLAYVEGMGTGERRPAAAAEHQQSAATS